MQISPLGVVMTWVTDWSGRLAGRSAILLGILRLAWGPRANSRLIVSRPFAMPLSWPALMISWLLSWTVTASGLCLKGFRFEMPLNLVREVLDLA